MKRISLFCLGLALSANAVQAAYNVVDRYTIVEDKLKTQEMMRELGHDFLIDINVTANKNLPDVIDDADNVSGNTTQEKIDSATVFLRKYENTEQTLNAKINLGIPIFSFTAWGTEIEPNLRIGYNLGTTMGIRAETLSIDTILDFVGDDVPANIKNAVRDNFGSMSAGDDIIAVTCTNEGIPDSECDPYKNQYFVPEDDSVPNIFVMAKQDIKAGVHFDYKTENNYYGFLHLYALHRTDISLRISQDALARDGDVLDLGDEQNSQTQLTLDYRLGYDWERYSVFGSIEEVKIATLSDNKDKAGDLNYGTDPLLRVHGSAKFKMIGFELVPFVGVHKRSAYGFGEGIYGGTDLSFYTWGERLGVQLRGMVDTEHLTFMARAKLWLMQLEYALKAPTSSTVDNDVKVSSLHNVNIRFFF